MKLSDFSIKRPVFTIVIMFLIIILGAVSFFKIPVTLIPELNPPVGVVVTSYPGASPTEVSEKVTRPLETSLSTLPGLESIQSSSEEGSNFILLEFDWSSNIDDVQTDIMQRIDQTPIPEDSNQPQFFKFDPAQFPVIQLAVRATESGEDVRVLAEELETELLQTEGVASVNISGSLIEEIQISLDQEQMESRGLQQSDVVQLIQANNISLPGEPIDTENGRHLTTRVVSTLTSVDEVRDLVITVNPLDGENVTIGDVAEVAVAEQESNSETRANEEPAVLLSALQESRANTADVSEAFQTKLNELLEEERFQGVEADVLFDQGDYVRLAIGNIGQTLILGGVFAMLVLFFFLRGIVSPLIIGIAIPYSVIVTFVLMYFSDFALNIMTLGALALGIGMLVDNSIVVIENIERHLAMGKTPRKAASAGTKEVAGAITASTLTTVAVFVPVAFITGLIGQIFFEFAVTISFSLFASLAVALTVVPMMASRLLKDKKEPKKPETRRSGWMKSFERSVVWALAHRIIILVAALVFLGAGILGIYQVGTEFLPATDEGFATVSVSLENGSSLAATDEVVNLIEEELKKEEDVDVFVSLIGSTQQGQSQGTTETNTAEMYVKLVPLGDRERSVFEFVDEVQPRILEKVGERADVSFNLQTAAGSSPNTLTFTATDNDKERLDKAVTDISSAIRELPDVTELTNDRDETIEEIQVRIKRDAATEYGMAPAQIAQTVNNMTRGVLATQVLSENDEVLSVFVGLDEQFRDSEEKLRTMKLRTPAGQFVTLEQLADVEISEGPVDIKRVDQADSVAFTLQHKSNVTLGEMSDKVDKALEKLNLDKDTQISFGGDRELFENAIDDVTLAIVLAVVLVYIVMAAQFESFKYPFVIMFTVPLMVIGVALALFLTQTPISITAVIGILVLVGIVVNNGIVLVDYINQRKEAGMDSYEAIVTSVHDRLRPILMTALTTILGLIPLALGIGEGTEINQPMGIAVIGGLISSTFLTLYVIPIVYSLFDRQTRRMNRKTN
ncbi:cation transporter [Planococcus glaciei]|uniref:Efflux RND transporter permease subunit n=1 Tax=Planococcus glaciei TaxID=459472 RepID=A0A7H8Q6W1_9BACL|nr:efflux RND transporter permease subunit [Planococcus glaciei]ETP68573.1 cation transporter [Planococcus glaciei CHR43]KOF11433.1 cation transporter [Planococcus glaciei]MBX0313580.1 efflux RND transporter permease subunit [Planococcus glaciei]QKX49271.1 efflux RND transporter permease subunit [Planococcus glaciei]